jgi:hypothetical protein
MEAKDYTNIAGTPFQPYVNDQIEIRKEIVNKETRSQSELLWLTNRNSWIRISSGVDVKDDNPYFLNERGNILSKKYILQAGLVDHTGGNTSYKLRSGIGSNDAYGIGGTDFGYKPMPGLENLSIKTGGRLGTLREATFDFTCYNMEQLDIMNALYMKLGFSVLIEWGHIPYIDNKTKKLETNPFPLEFYGIKTKEQLMADIQTKRVDHSGNYDAMWGTVKNFSYAFGENGEFKCKVDLVGAGDILESLKINQSGNTEKSKTSEGESPYPVVADANKSLLNEALYLYYNYANEATSNPYIIKDLLNTYFKKLNIKFEDFSQNDNLIKKGFHYSLLSKLNENNGGTVVNIPDIFSPEYYFSKFKLDLTIDGEGDESDNSTPSTQVYITLGHLFLLTLATGGLFDKKEDKTNPYIYIDVNNETNRCYTFPGHCSMDPTVCLIGSEGLPFGIESDLFSKEIQPNFPFYDGSDPDLGGRFMWTLVNIDFIVKTLRKYATSNSKGDVNFVDFAQDILTGISKACGGFNEFRIVPDDDTRCIRIFDDRTTTSFKYETSKFTTIPILGKSSIVYNFNYTSKISPNTANQTVIAAQAQDKGIQGNKDALSFSHLNEGLENRLSPSRVDAVEDLNSNDISESKLNKYIELRNLLEKIYNGEGVFLSDYNEDVNESAKREFNVEGEELPTKFILNKNDPTKVKSILNSVIDKLVEKLQKSKIKPTKEELKALDDAKKAVKKLITEGKLDINNLKTIKAFNEEYTDKGDIEFTLDEMNSYLAVSLDNNYESPNYNSIGLPQDSDLEEEWQEILEKEGGGPSRTNIDL